MTDGRSTLSSIVYYLTAAIWVLAILLGGGTRVGLAADLVIQIASLPLLLLAIYMITTEPGLGNKRVYVAILAFVAVLMLLQLVPLPPSIWSSLPSRAFLNETYAAAGMPLPWMPLSLAPHATIYAAATLIPSFAVFLGTLVVAADKRYGLVIWPLIASLISVFVGELQFSSASGNLGLSLYQANAGYAAGLFANRNHYAALNYAMLPLACGWMILSQRSESRSRLLGLVLGGTIVLVLLVGIAIAYSRAGVFLGTISIVCCIWLFWTSRGEMKMGRWISPVIVGISIVIFVAFQFGFLALLEERGATDDQRQIMSAKTLELVETAPLVGYGFGSFVPIYMQAEKQSDIAGFYVNHAHNDWLEIVLEGGAVAGLVLLAFAGWVAVRSFRLWWTRMSPNDAIVMARAADISAILLLVHSLVDYPLRTTALAATFAACCAFMITQRGGRRQGQMH